MGPLSLTNPWVILGIAATVLGTSFAVGKWQRADGALEAKNECLLADNKELLDKNDRLTKANARILVLQNEARTREAAHNLAMNDLETKLQKEKATNDDRKKRDAAAARDGSLVLRVPASICAGSAVGGGGAPGEARPTAPLGDGAASIELPRKTTGDLHDLANDADSVADQLRTCQQVVLEDRKTCNATAVNL